MSYVYIESEKGLWTVGFYEDSKWHSESDHRSALSAASRVNYLNGFIDQGSGRGMIQLTVYESSRPIWIDPAQIWGVETLANDNDAPGRNTVVFFGSSSRIVVEDAREIIQAKLEAQNATGS